MLGLRPSFYDIWLKLIGLYVAYSIHGAYGIHKPWVFLNKYIYNILKVVVCTSQVLRHSTLLHGRVFLCQIFGNVFSVEKYQLGRWKAMRVGLPLHSYSFRMGLEPETSEILGKVR